MPLLDRDPREDPKPGDVLALYSGAVAEVLDRTRFLFFWDLVKVECSTKPEPHWVTLGAWREWAKAAHVVAIEGRYR